MVNGWVDVILLECLFEKSYLLMFVFVGGEVIEVFWEFDGSN